MTLRQARLDRAVRAAYLGPIQQVLRDLGVGPTGLLAECAVNDDVLFDHPDKRICHAYWQTLPSSSCEARICSMIGLTLAQAAPNLIGPTGATGVIRRSDRRQDRRAGDPRIDSSGIIWGRASVGALTTISRHARFGGTGA